MSGSGPQSALNSLLRVIISVIINKAIFKCNNDGLLNILFRILNALRQVTNVSNDDASVACHFVWFGRPRPYIHSITEWLICVILYGYYFNDNFDSRGERGGGAKGYLQCGTQKKIRPSAMLASAIYGNLQQCIQNLGNPE